MNPLFQAFAGVGVRALMLLAGSHGVELGSEQAESIVNAFLIIIPLIWSVIQKWNQNDKLESAKLTAQLAQRRD